MRERREGGEREGEGEEDKEEIQLDDEHVGDVLARETQVPRA